MVEHVAEASAAQGSARRAGPVARVRQVAGSPDPVVIVAWFVILATSLLPTVIEQEALGGSVTLAQRTAGGVLVLGVAYLFTLAFASLRALRRLFAVLLTLVVARWLVFDLIAQAGPVRRMTADPSFAVYMPTEVVLNLLVTVAILGVLGVMTRDRRSFFLARGDLAAEASPIGWLAVRSGDRWTAVGRNLAIGISLGTLAFLVINGTPTAGLVGVALPALPAILFAAALNAFNEEVSYKASILSAVEAPLGRRDALRVTAAYFGIAHFYGVPYGLAGVALAWFLGWILARSMAETRGMAWAWGIHFVQDVLIFAFMAAGAIVPGGA